MSVLIRSDVCVHLPIEEFEKKVIEANRKMAALGLKRIDKGGGNYPKPEKQAERGN